MHAWRPTALVLSVLAATGCASSSAGSGGSPSTSATPSSGTALVTNLTPQNFGGGQVSGRARLAPTGRAGEYRAEIEIRGAGFQNRMPWMVRTGRCGEQGQEVGNPVAYRVLETGPDGIAKLNANVSVSIPEGQTHSIVVMKSQTERNIIVSCGVLSPEG